MTNASAHGFSKEAPKDDYPRAKDGLAELRGLLLGPEQAQLAKIQEQLDNTELNAENLSRILPDAVTLRSTQDKQLAKALMPTVEETIKVSVKKDPRALVDALFPVMGPAIRKAISEALSSMIQSLNQVLEQSFSLQGLKWRLEAIRTGRSFAEIVLLHTLLYRVEQVFLIHKETGLMLQHVVAGTAIVQDADMVSGMLRAIQDFVHDSFGVQKGDALETLQVGELTVWIEEGPKAILAGVIRGNAPKDLRLVFQNAIESIHLEQGDALESFDGDAAPFEASRPHLEDCLQTKYQVKDEKRPNFLLIPLAAILIALGLWGFFSFRNNQRWTDYLEKLSAEHGIVVTGAEKRHGKYFVSGLRDPLAADPVALLKKTDLDPEKVISRWEPYQALDPEFVLARSKAILEPPETATLKVENGILYAEGAASHQWIIEARKLARAIPGITQFQEENLVDTDLRELETNRREIEKQVLHFVVGTTKFLPGQNDALQSLVARIQNLYGAAQPLGKSIRIEIVGHTSNDGLEERNLRLSKERADRVLSILASSGIEEASLSPVGVGAKEPLREEITMQNREFNRSVSFRVTLTNGSNGKVSHR